MTKLRKISLTSLILYLLFSSYYGMEVLGPAGQTARAQRTSHWSPQERIPGYRPEIEPPVLIADQNRTVHAFTSQKVEDDEPEIAIFYNRWTLERGWTVPVDILLSPIKQEARLLGAYLDPDGVMHVIFFGGDEVEANIYYSKSLAVNADGATAWSKPKLVAEGALIPGSGAITGDGSGKLVIVFNGKGEGNGYYAIYSTDRGDSWSDPTPIFQTYDYELFPFGIKVSTDQRGGLHAIWELDNIAGQGRAIYYAGLLSGETEWSEPVELASVETGLGTKAPNIIAYHDRLHAIFYENGKFLYRCSSDLGQTWTDPEAPFIHVGLNGPASFAIDSNNDLHMFWGQRITGSPDIHGMWHSLLLGDQWSAPEAVVSGPRVMAGERSFDPYEARSIVSQGNLLLVAWRTDPGSGLENENGIWYSYSLLDSPEQPIAALPTSFSDTAALSKETATAPVSTPPPNPQPERLNPQRFSTEAGPVSRSPANDLIVSLVPVLGFLTVIIVRVLFLSLHRR